MKPCTRAPEGLAGGEGGRAGPWGKTPAGDPHCASENEGFDNSSFPSGHDHVMMDARKRWPETVLLFCLMTNMFLCVVLFVFPVCIYKNKYSFFIYVIKKITRGSLVSEFFVFFRISG